MQIYINNNKEISFSFRSFYQKERFSFVFLFLSLGNPKNRKWSYIAVKGGLEVARSSSSNGGGDAIQLLRTDVCKRVMRRVYI